MKVRVKDIKTAIVGRRVSGSNSDIGYQIEKLIQSDGWQIQPGAGPDILDFGIEIKGRHVDATSNQTICKMSRADIIATPYHLSPVKNKIQQQIRVYHNSNTILRATFYDFSDPYIQQLLGAAYEACRKKLQEGWCEKWVPGNYWGNFEKDLCNENFYAYRITPNAYKKLEAMSKDTFFELFDYN